MDEDRTVGNLGARHTFMAEAAGPLACALLLFSGFFKGNTLLDWLPIDLTLLASAFVLMGVMSVALRKGLSLRIDPRLLLMAFTFVPAWLYTALDEYAVSKLVGLAVTVLAMVGSFYLVRSSRQQFFWVWSFVAGGALLLVGTIFTPNEEVAAGRLALDGSNTIAAARATGVALVVMFAYAMLLSKRGIRFWLFLLSSIFAVGMVATGSRGPLLAAAISMIVVALVTRVRGSLKRVLLIAIALIASWFYIAESDGTGAERIEAALSGEQSGTATRELMWAAAIRAILSFPTTVFGVGWGNFGDVLGSGESALAGAREYPHNLFLEVVVEGGWLPGIAALLFVSLSLARLVRNASDPLTASLLSIALFFVANAMVSGDINDNRMMWAALAVAWAPKPSLEDRGKADSPAVDRAASPAIGARS